MANRSILSRILVVTGTALVWIPILAPLLFSSVALIRLRQFHLDFLMPAELFPAALIGGCLLFWAALRERSHQKLIGWGLGLAVVALAAGQVLAVVIGLASGESEAAGWRWALVLGSIFAYSLLVVLVGVGGILLLRSLFRPQTGGTAIP